MSKLKRAKKLIGKKIDRFGRAAVIIAVDIYPPKTDFWARQSDSFLGMKTRDINGNESIFKISSRLNPKIS
jgi:hypothetical protein